MKRRTTSTPFLSTTLRKLANLLPYVRANENCREECAFASTVAANAMGWSQISA